MITISDPIQKAEYLNKHLTYRINSMLAYDLIIYRKTTPEFGGIKDRCYGDSTIVEPIFEISLVFARSLLNFLGLTLNGDSINRFCPKGDDLTLKSLFPERDYCPLDEPLVLENHNALCTIIKLANKSVAHLTSEITETQTGDLEILPQARKTVYKLMLKYVPEMNMEKIWWTKQMPDK